MKKSNVRQLSNVYILKDGFWDDKEFQAQVRGRESLEKMLIHLTGKSWIKGHVSVKNDIHRLTPLQQSQFNMESYCPKGKRTEKIWGLVKTEKGLEKDCRCENTFCSYFKDCRPDYVPQKQKYDETVFSQDKPLLEMKLLDLPEPVLLSSDTNTEVILVKTNLLIQLDDEQLIPDLNHKKDIQPKIVLTEEGLPAILDEELQGNDQDVIIQAEPDEKLLVLAGPGTGKTYSLIEKLKYMVGVSRSVEADTILLLCYTKAAVKEIKERLKLEIETGAYSDDLAFIDIRTFDSFATLVLIHKEQDMTHMEYDERIEAATAQIVLDPAILENLSHLIVDEVQDLVGPRARLVRVLLENLPDEAGFTLLGDHLQGIYDYQVRTTPGELSSRQLLKWVDTEYGAQLKTIRLSVNHRQSSALMPFAVSSRMLLESQQKENIKQFLQQIKSLPSRGKAEKVTMPSGQGTVAILCRSNGEVLKISSALRARQIKHSVRRNNTPVHLPVSIADLLNKWEGAMNREQFNKFNAKEKLCTPEYSEKMYQCLETVQNNFLQNSKRHSINLNSADLIKALSAGTPLPDEIYENGNSSVVLSTIHQAKGREYDSVIMTCSNFDRITEEELLDEAKVYYVGVTRARTGLYTVEPVKGYLKKCDGAGQRWYETYKRGENIWVRSIEIGMVHDIDESGFVSSSLLDDPEDNQHYIRNMVKEGDEIELDRSQDDIYEIIHDQQRIIGLMSKQFTQHILAIMQEVWGPNAWSRPQRISGLFVDQIHSVIKRPETLGRNIRAPYIKGVWYGVSISGLGNVVLYMKKGGD